MTGGSGHRVVRTAGLVAAVSAAAGLPVGLLWWLLAPLTPAVKRADGLYRVGGDAETAIAADGWFAVCTLAAGVVAGVAVSALLRRDRLGALVGLAAGGVLGALVAWGLGVVLGPDSFEAQAAQLQVGDRFDGPLRLSALGVLLVWPVSAVILFFGVVAGLDSTAEEDERRELSRAGAPEQSAPV